MNTVTNQRIKQNGLVFRQLQIMLAEFRRMYSQKVLVPAAVGVVMLQILITYLWIDVVRKGQATELALIVGIGMFGTAELSVFSMFLFGNLGKVYCSSTNSQMELRANKKTMMKRQFRKFAMSCPLLRIYLGDQNFVNPSTCLVFEEFVVDNLIGLLVI